MSVGVRSIDHPDQPTNRPIRRGVHLRLLEETRVRGPNLHTTIVRWCTPCIKCITIRSRNKHGARSRVDIPSGGTGETTVLSSDGVSGSVSRDGCEALASTARNNKDARVAFLDGFSVGCSGQCEQRQESCQGEEHCGDVLWCCGNVNR